MPAARRRLTLKDKLEIMVEQATCPLCGGKLGALDNLDWDHEQALARGGTDTNDNIRAVHRDCHKAKTFGHKHRRAGADVHEIRRTDRLENDHEEFRRRVLARECGEKRKPTATIKGRGFPKRKRKAAT
jgi:hypothetical protein